MRSNMWETDQQQRTSLSPIRLLALHLIFSPSHHFIFRPNIFFFTVSFPTFRPSTDRASTPSRTAACYKSSLSVIGRCLGLTEHPPLRHRAVDFPRTTVHLPHRVLATRCKPSLVVIRLCLGFTEHSPLGCCAVDFLCTTHPAGASLKY